MTSTYNGYFSDLVLNNDRDQSALFKILNNIMHRKSGNRFLIALPTANRQRISKTFLPVKSKEYGINFLPVSKKPLTEMNNLLDKDSLSFVY